jgi:ADP-ribose pyrophosphatase YjhB (NUDIX family)
MRISAAALALIERVGCGDATEYLTQWNDRWRAFSLIGGHVEPGESFRDCCVREVAEELELAPGVEFEVAPQRLGPRCDYTAYSQSALEATLYEIDLFPTKLLTAAAMAKIDAKTGNRWFSREQIKSGVTRDGHSIAEQVAMVLQLSGVFSDV